jgi:putative NADPH-quinone reductase
VNALVVFCHPLPGSFGGQCRDRVLAGLRAGGHEVRQRDLYAEGFRPEVSAWEREHQFAPASDKPDIAEHAADLRWCDTLVLVYPTWFSAQPAMLKGWFDRVWVNGVAYDLPEGSNRIRGRLRNIRRIVVVTTHGSSKTINALQGESGKRVVTRGIRVLCHRFARVRWIALYGIDRCTDAERAAFLNKVEQRLSAH